MGLLFFSLDRDSNYDRRDKDYAIFVQNLLASVRKLKIKSNFTFQHDSNPKHTSKSTKKDGNGLGMAWEWPCQNPDFNPDFKHVLYMICFE